MTLDHLPPEADAHSHAQRAREYLAWAACYRRIEREAPSPVVRAIARNERRAHLEMAAGQRRLDRESRRVRR